MSPQARTGTAKADDDEDEKAETSSEDAGGVTEPDGSNAHSIPLPTDIQAPIEPGEGATTFMSAEEAEAAADDDD